MSTEHSSSAGGCAGEAALDAGQRSEGIDAGECKDAEGSVADVSDSADELVVFAPTQPVRQLNPLVLAYIGDAVYEQFVRQYVISLPNHRPNHLHRQSTQFVSAKAQSRALHRLMDNLTEEESEVVRRGRNAKSGSVPKNADVMDYRYSTAFEALIGYLYYTKQFVRLRELMMMSLGLSPEENGISKEEEQ